MPKTKTKAAHKEVKAVVPKEEIEVKEGEKALDPELILAAVVPEEEEEDPIEAEKAAIEEDENEFGPDELNPFGDKWEE